MIVSKHTVVTIEGKTLTVDQWVRLNGLKYGTIWQRVRDGKSIEEAVTAPTKRPKKRCGVPGCEGKYFGKGYCNTHYYRIRRNGAIELRRESDESRFWSRVHFIPEAGCWIYENSGRSVYGSQSWNGKANVLAHRISWEIHNGPIPNGAIVCHKCDTPGCVNPAHLFVGDQSDNRRDMYEKRRHQHGERHFRAVLSEHDVRAIRSAPMAPGIIGALAELYGVSWHTIRGIRSRTTWKHI